MDADAPQIGPVAFARFVWAQLTSMRTALILLFALALVAIPGSIIPQRPANPIRVLDFSRENPELAKWYDRLGLFDVYSSAWFAAVYLLLMVSLVGCILPRIGVYARALRKPPPATPRRLERLPTHTVGTTSMDASGVLDAAASSLRAKRFRVRRDADSVGAERGYLREFGNLVFHISFIGVLVGVAVSSLWGYKGEVIVVEGQAFSNSLTQYDDLSTGGRFDPVKLDPFTIRLDEFIARFEVGPVQRGAAREFTAKVTVSEPGMPDRSEVMEVNHPVRVGRTSVHLIGHGYAPVVTVTDPLGNVALAGPVVFLPQDGNFTSMGVVKAPDARPERLAFEGYFLPTAVVDAQGPRSVFPDAFDPQLFINAWSGPPKESTGRPESIYSLDKTGLTQMTVDGTPVTVALAPGQQIELTDGSTLSFDTWQRWTKLQISSTPGLWLTGASIALAVIGMSLSLFVRPRRLWVRVTTSDGRQVVAIGGLDRADSRGGLAEDVLALAQACGVAQQNPEDQDAAVALKQIGE